MIGLYKLTKASLPFLTIAAAVISNFTVIRTVIIRCTATGICYVYNNSVLTPIIHH